ncbi:MAG: 30S ribosomal protein S13 [Candidatus Thermoplasmatota archaeon]|nr:30S ribosomal protein S13 [Candidatus Thermoplasmatota archaeon]MCL5888853.1 30S ribosomal protein S13 [Candidatus Thermoplasmatota archaeon]
MPDEKEKNDFQYIVRIASMDLNGERDVVLALADLKGIGVRLAETLTKKLNIDESMRLGDLSEEKIEEIRDYIESEEYEGIPSWMLNNRMDPVTGKNMNLVGNDLNVQIQDNVNTLKKIRSYRGIRHETHHKVRGQRTRSNGRKGLTVGVQRKKE